MRQPKRRLRTVVKWAGVVVCAAIAAGFQVSRGCSPGVTVVRYDGVSRQTSTLMVAAGCLRFRHDTRSGWTDPNPPPAEVYWGVLDLIHPVRWTPGWLVEKSGFGIMIPLWLFLLPSAIATALLWRRDHILTGRARAGQCARCAYDRRGLSQDAACPECGMVASA
jgi:hypothetical protein